MKIVISILVMLAAVTAVELELKDGSLVIGEVICEEKGKLVLKDGDETVSVYKKSIRRADTIVVEGSRKFMLGEEHILRDKNELIFINGSRDSLTLRLRKRETFERFAEKTLGPGDSAMVAVPDGIFFETVKYWRDNGEYHITGAPYLIETKCGTFSRLEVELKGYAGESFPQLKGPKRDFER